MSIKVNGFELKQKIKNNNAKRVVKYADKEIARLKCELKEIEKEKAYIEWQIEVFQCGKQSIEREATNYERGMRNV